MIKEKIACKEFCVDVDPFKITEDLDVDLKLGPICGKYCRRKHHRHHKHHCYIKLDRKYHKHKRYFKLYCCCNEDYCRKHEDN